MKIIVNIVVAGLILATGIIGLKIFGQKPEVVTEEKASGTGAIPVITEAVVPYDRPFDISIDGEAVTYRIVTVGAEVEGRIVTKSEKARGGTFIQKGDLLFEIDSTNYQLQIDSLRAQVLQAKEEINAISVDLQNSHDLIKLAEEDWQLHKNQLARMKELLNRRTANDAEVETAMKQELAARNTLQGLKNQIRTLEQQQKTKAANEQLVEAQLRRAESDLARCRVFSPLEGRIVDDLTEEGDYIKSGDDLVHISDGSRMEIKCQLRAEELAWIWQQQPGVPVPVPDLPKAVASLDPLNIPKVPCEVAYTFEGVETIWDGYLVRIEGTGIDRDTRTFPCRVLVEKPRRTRVSESAGGRTITPPTLLSGMYVTVRFPVESPLPLLQLPIEAVRPGGQIWVKRDDRLKILEASLAHTQQHIALVRRDGSGFHDGDRVIVSPLTSVQNGMAVVEAEEDSE